MGSSGVAPGQTPPPPMISGPIIAGIAAAILIVSAPRFFADSPTHATSASEPTIEAAV